MLYEGEGGPTDPETALEWIRRAAAGGESCAVHFLSQNKHAVDEADTAANMRFSSLGTSEVPGAAGTRGNEDY